MPNIMPIHVNRFRKIEVKKILGSSMKYIEDKNLNYLNLLKKNLKEYNLKHTGIRESSTKYFYVL